MGAVADVTCRVGHNGEPLKGSMLPSQCTADRCRHCCASDAVCGTRGESKQHSSAMQIGALRKHCAAAICHTGRYPLGYINVMSRSTLTNSASKFETKIDSMCLTSRAAQMGLDLSFVHTHKATPWRTAQNQNPVPHCTQLSRRIITPDCHASSTAWIQRYTCDQTTSIKQEQLDRKASPPESHCLHCW